MNRQLTTLAVILRWLAARKQIQEQQYAARVPVIRAQLDAMRGSAW